MQKIRRVELSAKSSATLEVALSFQLARDEEDYLHLRRMGVPADDEIMLDLARRIWGQTQLLITLRESVGLWAGFVVEVPE